MVRIAPSILSADFARLADAVAKIESGGADFVHVDVMDGHFVTKLPLDVHLMISEPDRYLEAFRDAGAAMITVHAEVLPHLHRTLTHIRSLGAKAGVAVNPSTPVLMVRDVIAQMDHLLVMSVNPGFGGQTFIPHSLAKIAEAREMIAAARGSTVIEVDGGVDRENAAAIVQAGASILVAGASVFGTPDAAEATRGLRRAASVAA
jgi:ribulose-phosphate 3-epimerase